MTSSPHSQQQLVAWLKDRGHSPEEIAVILERLARYDQLTTTDALMDAIARGEVNLDAIVQEFRDEEA